MNCSPRRFVPSKTGLAVDAGRSSTVVKMVLRGRKRLPQRNLRERRLATGGSPGAAPRKLALAVGGWGNRQPAGLWSLAVSVRVRVPQPVRLEGAPCRVT